MTTVYLQSDLMMFMTVVKWKTVLRGLIAHDSWKRLRAEESMCRVFLNDTGHSCYTWGFLTFHQNTFLVCVFNQFSVSSSFCFLLSLSHSFSSSHYLPGPKSTDVIGEICTFVCQAPPLSLPSATSAQPSLMPHPPSSHMLRPCQNLTNPLLPGHDP